KAPPRLVCLEPLMPLRDLGKRTSRSGTSRPEASLMRPVVAPGKRKMTNLTAGRHERAGRLIACIRLATPQASGLPINCRGIEIGRDSADSTRCDLFQAVQRTRRR